MRGPHSRSTCSGVKRNDGMPQLKAPVTVDPSLWRQSRLNMQHGLFEVVPGVYQVRGFDIANMTLIEGDGGVIVVDTLTSIEGARAARGALFQVSRQQAGRCGHLYPHPYRPLGWRAGRAR
jgi:alkyl sulfatase BDS1-like metallo-beta-lactamase superfamily hydrolase